MTCETVNIISDAAPGGYVVINKSDFDPAIHKAYEPPAPETSKTEGGGASKTEGDQKPEGQAKSKAKPEK